MVTIVLVHGAFADGSSWNRVIELLLNKGYGVVAPSNPLRGVEHDSAYVTSVVEQIAGPVILVGHSYAGAVISNVAPKTGNVVGLVFVAAFATDEGERLGDVTGTSKDAILGTALVPQNYPTDKGDIAVELVVDPAHMHEVFAADLPAAPPPCSPQPSDPSRLLHLTNCLGPRRGGRSSRGPSSQQRTRPQAPTSCARWRSAPAQKSQRWTARTWSWFRTPRL